MVELKNSKKEKGCENMTKNRHFIHGGLNSRNDAGCEIPSNIQIHRNEMSGQTRKDISILGAKGQAAPMDLAHGLCPIINL